MRTKLYQKMNELIHYFEKIFEDDNNSEEENNNEENFVYDNNDGINFILTIFLYFKLLICSIYDYLVSYLSTMKHFLYQLQFTLILIIFLFSFVVTFEENYNISTDIIINAYFTKNNMTYITQDMILEKENKINSENNLNANRHKNCANNKVGLKDFTYSDIEGNNCNRKQKLEDFDINNDEDEEIKKLKEFVNGKMNKDINSSMKDIYFLNFIPVKSSLINIFCFSISYFFINSTLKSKIRGALILNFVFLATIFYFLQILYQNEYYLASNFLYILFLYVNKNLIDSIYLKLKYKRKEFEIFSRNLIAVNLKQFKLKIIILVEATSLSAVLSILLFKYFLNYIIYYLCLLTLIAFLGNCIEQYAQYYLKPIKNIIMFFVGLFNLILSKFILKLFIFEDLINDYNDTNKSINNNIEQFKVDSFYLINDLFSFYCLNYINEYIDYQYRIFCNYKNKNNNYNINFRSNLNISIINLNESETDKFFVIKNKYLWCIFITSVVLIGNLGVYTEEFICFIISLYMTKIMMDSFCKLNDYKTTRIINNVVTFNFILFIPRMSSIKDIYLINLFSSITNLNENILLFTFKFIFLLGLFYYIININLMISIDYNSKIFEKEKKEEEKKTNILSFYNLLFMFSEIFFQYFIICLMIVIYKYYETNLVFKILYLFLIMIFQALKIPTITDLKQNIINSISNKKYISDNNENVIKYNIYIFAWIIISLRLIKLSGPENSLIYFLNHLNLILLINYYIFSDKNNNNFCKVLIIILLALGYYIMNSSIFIINAIAIVISPIIKKYNDENDKKLNECANKEQKLKMESIRVYNRLTFIFLMSILLFYLVQIGYVNIFDFFEKSYKEIFENIKIVYNELNEKKNFEPNEGIEIFLISKLFLIKT